MVAEISTDKPRKLSQMARIVLLVVRLAARRGHVDMTLAEILHALRAGVPGRTFEKSSLSRELTHLALDGLLLRRMSKRKSAWEALPVGVDQQSAPASFAYYVPGAGAGRPPAAMTSQGGAGRAAVAAGAAVAVPAVVVVPAGPVVAPAADFY